MSHFYSSKMLIVPQTTASEFFSYPSRLVCQDRKEGRPTIKFNNLMPVQGSYFETEGEIAHITITEINDIQNGFTIESTNWAGAVALNTLSVAGAISIKDGRHVEIANKKTLEAYRAKYFDLESVAVAAVSELHPIPLRELLSESLWWGNDHSYEASNMIKIYDTLHKAMERGETLKSEDGFSKKFDQLKIKDIVEQLAYGQLRTTNVGQMAKVMRITIESIDPTISLRMYPDITMSLQIEKTIARLVFDKIAIELQDEFKRARQPKQERTKLTKRTLNYANDYVLQDLFRTVTARNLAIYYPTIVKHLQQKQNTNAWYNKLAKIIEKTVILAE